MERFSYAQNGSIKSGPVHLHGRHRKDNYIQNHSMELKKTGKVQNKQAANLNSVVHINVILPAILK